MKNAYAISSVSRQIVKVGETLDSLVGGIQDTEQGVGDLSDVYAAMLMDELEHAQMLILKLTELITQEGPETAAANTDGEGGSAFFEGDLTTEKNGEDATEEGGDKK